MNNKSVLIITAIAALVVAAVFAGTYFYASRIAPAPILPSAGTSPETSPAQAPEQDEKIIGGETDEHGCLSAAGYSWCEAQQKCLRVFEEFCPDQAADLTTKIKDASGITLLATGEATFNWIISDGETAADRTISGLAYRAEGVKRTDYERAEKFLNENYEQDSDNLAGGVVGGQRGYRDGYMACVLDFRHREMAENAEGAAEPVGDDLDVKLECGYYNPNDNDIILLERKIEEILAAKYEKPVSGVSAAVTKSNETHAAGSVSFGPGPGDGGMFLAVKQGELWKVVYDGNGSIDCMVMRQTYRFPADILEGFCD